VLGPETARGGGERRQQPATQQRGLRNRRRFRDYGQGAAGLVDLGTGLLEHMYEREVKRQLMRTGVRTITVADHRGVAH